MKLLKGTHPRTIYLDNLAQMSPTVFESGCRDEAPTTNALASMLWSSRQLQRPDEDEIKSLQKIAEGRKEEDRHLQKVLLQPKGIMLWSHRTIEIFHERCKEDVVYIDATGGVVRKSKTD